MSEILVLAAHDGESVKKVTTELLTLARRFGEPAAGWPGPGAEGGRHPPPGGRARARHRAGTPPADARVAATKARRRARREAGTHPAPVRPRRPPDTAEPAD